MPIHRIQTIWTGFPGAPGYTSFYFAGEVDDLQAESSMLAVGAFWQRIMSHLPSSVTLRVSQEVENIDEATGTLIGYATDEQGIADRTGGDDTAYSGASGAVLTWLTSTVNAGRRVRGRTFLVPLGGSAYEDDGTLSPGTLSSLRDAASSLVDESTAQPLVVWSRPRGGASGVSALVTASRVVDKAAVLRSRRD